MTVSKESLNAIANLVFVDLLIEKEGDTVARPECNLRSDASDALYQMLVDHDDEQSREYFSAYTSGVEFGLTVAAAIITGGFDTDAAREAVRLELKQASKYWPKTPMKVA